MNKLEIGKKSRILYALTIVVVIIGDQLSKMIVSSSMLLSSSQTIIDNFFYFTYAQNKGGAWGLLQGQQWLFLSVAFIAMFGLVYYFTKTKKSAVLARYGLVLIFSGLIGNLIDRICFGYVRDFLDFIIFGYNFPIFNIADIAIILGLGLFILEELLEGKLYGKKKD